MTNGEIIEVAASEGTSASPCWPLPPEWDIVEYHGPLGFSGAGPAWNDQWLLGLEKYVRSIVRDELSKANGALHRQPESQEDSNAEMHH